MLPELAPHELRVLGCLMEKSVTTPDQYPLTLNALTNACNQKSSRDPVMSLTSGEVMRAVRDLEGKHLVRTEENFKRGVEKFSQRFCNTSFSDVQLSAAQYAVMTLLVLRGRQTPGELRSRSGRLHAFAENDAVVDALRDLMERDGGALVVRLPRVAGRRDNEYMHLLGGPVEEGSVEAPVARVKAGPSSELEERVSRLEQEVAELKRRLS